MTRALTAPELALIRTDGQASELFMAILTPAPVFAARINEAFTAWDGIAQLTFDTVTTGAFADVLEGMTLYVGTSAGAYDVGMLRIRKAATSAILYIGETSQVEFDNNQYLTVVDEIGLWARQSRITGDDDDDKTVFMDYDIAYSDQHEDMDPVPVLGPIASALWLVSGTVDYTPPTAASSWVLGSTISAYAWTTSGGSVANETTATPTFTYVSAGTYRIGCTVTAANGKSKIGYRYIFVYDDDNLPYTEFTLRSCTGDDNGVSFSVDMDGEASAIRERSLAVLFERAYYGTTQQSIGASLGNENIVALGWIDKEAIEVNPEHGKVSFQVFGPKQWLGKIAAFPSWFTNSAAAPATWTEFEDLTVDMAVFNLLHWRSTATSMMDVTLSGDTRIAPSLEGPADVLLEQISSVSKEPILAMPKCDRYGALFLQIDSQYLAEADRAAIPVVMAITSYDWLDSISIQRTIAPPASILELSAIAYDGATEERLYSKAFGNVLSLYGRAIIKDRLLVDDQAHANIVSGLIISRQNNEYPVVRIPLSSNQRMSDVCPIQYVTLSLAAADNERGIIWTDKKFIVRKWSITHDLRSGKLLVDLECEAETFEQLSITDTRPQSPTENPSPLPDFPVPDWPLIPIGGPYKPPPDVIPQDPDIDPDDTCPANLSAPDNGPWNLWMEGTLTSTMRPASLYGYMWAVMRIGTATNKTSYLINAQFQERIAGGPWVESTDADWYTVYPVDSNGNRLTAGTKDAIVSQNQRTGVFNPPAAAVIRFVEFAITPETDSGATWTAPVQSGPPALAWTYDGVSDTQIIPYQGGYRMVMQSTFTCITLTPISGTAGGTAITTIFLGPIVGTSYLEIEARMSVLSAPASYSDATIRNAGLGVASDDITVHALTYSNDDFYATASGSNTGLWSYFSFVYPDGVVAVGTYVFEMVITVKRAPTKRVLMDSAFLYNICPRPSTE